MLLRYTAKNFFSFRDEVEVDFTAGLQAGERPGIVTTDLGHKVNLVTGVFGANASGKSNILMPLAFLAEFILQSAAEKPGSYLSYMPFLFVPDSAAAPTRLTLEFEFNRHHYRYELELLGSRVTKECLERKKVRFSYLFERHWNHGKQSYDFKFQDIGPAASIPQRENASWLSVALTMQHPLAVELRPFFDGFASNVGTTGRFPEYDIDFENVHRVSEHYLRNPALLRKASELMANFDLGLDGIEIESHQAPSADGFREIWWPFGIHRAKGAVDKVYRLLLFQESRGTQALFVLLRYLLPVLDRGGIAFIDEFESGLHPHMVRAIVDLFFNPSTNPNNAQLIATFHTDFLLRDTLHKYQVYLVDKDSTLNSTAYRLDSLKGVRNVDNLHEKYHAGAYGGVPKLR